MRPCLFFAFLIEYSKQQKCSNVIENPKKAKNISLQHGIKKVFILNKNMFLFLLFIYVIIKT